MCAVFVLDAGYMVDAARFLSGSLAALATMVQLEVGNYTSNLQNFPIVFDLVHNIERVECHH